MYKYSFQVRFSCSVDKFVKKVEYDQNEDGSCTK